MVGEDEENAALRAENATLRAQLAEFQRVQTLDTQSQQNVQRIQIALAAGAIIGTWNWHPTRDTFTVDEGFTRAFGLKISQASVELSLDEVLKNVHLEDRPALDAAIQAAVERGGAYAHRYRVRRADQNFYWIEANVRVDYDVNGKRTSFPGVVVDVNERYNLEAERDQAMASLREFSANLEQQVTQRTAELMQAQNALRQAQKMEAVGQLTGGVAHDFNNLLTVIRSSCHLLKRPDLTDERRTRYVAAISTTVDRAAKLTGQLLAFARRQTLQPEVFAACDSVRVLTDMMMTLAGTRVRIVTQLPEKPCFINADASQFDTVLVNLAVNARDAMGDEGSITIKVEAVDGLPTIREQEGQAGAYVAVSLSDTGCGIPLDLVERIFEPFFTTKAPGKGTGLGLSQVFGFAKQSGGEIDVKSTLDQGTTFTLYLPRVAAPEAVAKVEEPEALIDGHGLRVLVVEDNMEVGTMTTQSLAELGYTTVHAPDARAALEELKKPTSRFDVVFSDVMMPGMSGIELGQEIRRLYHDLPVVLTSGYSHVLAQNGTYGFELLHKPYAIETLSRMLSKAAIWQRRKRLLTS